MIKTLSSQALLIIDQYLHFKIGSGSCSVPYFNNKSLGGRIALRSEKGKGSPKEILDEIIAITTKNHVDISAITGESLKKTLTDNNIGIDCSAFVYYILNAECEEMKKGPLSKHIRFVNCHGILGKIRCSLRPIENCDVATFAHERNSKIVSLKEVRPGDIITMIGGPDNNDRNHILVVHQVEYANADTEKSVPTKIYYSHAVAYPEDGIYGTGIKQGMIELIDLSIPLSKQQWNEEAFPNEQNPMRLRANKSQTELRRLNKLC